MLLEDFDLTDHRQVLGLAAQGIDQTHDRENGNGNIANGGGDPAEDGNDPKHRAKDVAQEQHKALICVEFGVGRVLCRQKRDEEQEISQNAHHLVLLKKRNFHCLYDFSVIGLTYSSSRMASVRLTRLQVETIFKKGKVRESFEPMKVSDVIEVLNHIHCVDYILDHVMEPLTQKFIRKLHQILMTGTVDEYREQVRPGEYRTVTSRPRDRQLLHPDKIHSSLAELITTYENQTEIDAIIDLTCNLCRLHQQSGFTAALKLAHRLSHELNTP